jgi:hypothetical protein
VFEPLADPTAFAEVFVHEVAGTSAWPNGIDLDPTSSTAITSRHSGFGDVGLAHPR